MKLLFLNYEVIIYIVLHLKLKLNMLIKIHILIIYISKFKSYSLKKLSLFR